MAFFDAIFGQKGLGLDRSARAEELYGGVDPTGQLGGAAGDARRFGQQAGGEYTALGGEAAAQRDALRRRAMGRDSLSAEQLRQGMGAVAGTQMGMAAGASPANQAMAARMASANVAQQQGGMAGTAAQLGIQERAAAEQQLGNMILGQRQQALSGTLGGQQGAMSGYGAIEQARTNRYGQLLGAPTAAESGLGIAQGVGQMAAMASDRRLKKKVRSADKEGDELLKALKATKWEYKDPDAHGDGEFVGIMAQDLEKSKAGKRAVIDTPGGKMVHGARLATALAATLPGLDRRLRKLEKR